MSINEVSVADAHAAQARGAIYVDVRSTIEYAQGHPTGAVNVPLQEPDEDTGHVLPNPDFIRVMQANFPADAVLLVGCQSGGRSQRACRMLAAFGFTNVTNVSGGYGGGHAPGWADSGLPCDTASTAGGAYRDLLARADQLTDI